MNTHRSTRPIFAALLPALALLAGLLASCVPAAPTATAPTLPSASTQPVPAASATALPAATQPEPSASATTPAPVSAPAEISFAHSAVASGLTVETIDAVPLTTDRPWWEAAPLYRRVTLNGYPVADHMHRPQIFVYPVADLAGYNENSARIAADLVALLQLRATAPAASTSERLPFLPLYNAAQVFHAQVRFLDFKNGSGVRYLTQHDQAPLPVNNRELVYTYQGLTADGRYYVAAVLPVTHPELPSSEQVTAQTQADLSDFPAYLARTAAWLEEQPAAAFTPDLAALDALVASIEIR